MANLEDDTVELEEARQERADIGYAFYRVGRLHSRTRSVLGSPVGRMAEALRREPKLRAELLRRIDVAVADLDTLRAYVKRAT